jgi:uncharacterized protein YoxC
MSFKDKIQGIKSRFEKAKALLLGNQQLLGRIRGRLRTNSQKIKYQRLALKHRANVNSFRSIEAKIKKLQSVIDKVKGIGRRIKGLFSFSRKKGIGELGIAPIIIAGALAAGILVALGTLIQKNITLKEELDALNEELDRYESEPEGNEYENEDQNEED